MVETKIKSFETRLARIDRIHAAGGAFEAAGSLGRSYFDAARPKARRSFPWRGVALILLGALLFKGTLLAALGDSVYEARVTALAEGSIPGQICAWVLTADAPTQLVAALLSPYLS